MTKKVVDEKAAAPAAAKKGMTWPVYTGKAIKGLVILVVALAAFWWFSLVPRAQENYPIQIRSACHAEANKFVQDQMTTLSDEQKATYNQLSVYEIQYTLCRRANGVSD